MLKSISNVKSMISHEDGPAHSNENSTHLATHDHHTADFQMDFDSLLKDTMSFANASSETAYQSPKEASSSS